jgi:hypothetical protein
MSIDTTNANKEGKVSCPNSSTRISKNLDVRNDLARLAELRRLMILDSCAERAYDDITRLLATSLDVPL